MRIVVILLFVALLTGCVNAKKATRYFDKHSDKASAYCSTKFPIWERVDTVYTNVDSAAYNQAYYELWGVLDSLLANPLHVIYYDTGNVNYVRTVTKWKVKEVLKPCLDSAKTIYVYQEDKGITSELRKNLDTANKISYHHKEVARLRLKIIFGLLALVVITTAYQSRKLWLTNG